MFEILKVIILILHEFLRVFNGFTMAGFESTESFNLFINFIKFFLLLFEINCLLHQGFALYLTFFVILLEFLLLFMELLLQLVQLLDSGARLQLELDKLFVLFIDVLNKFFVFNLELMEVDELQVVTHLHLVLYVSFRLQDLAS